MARGWESKSVESQIEGADRSADRGAALTAEERERRRKRESLELSRRRVLLEIETTRSAIRRTSLGAALAFLEEELGKLGPPSPS
jgi:CHASE3 domain sensor protein